MSALDLLMSKAGCVHAGSRRTHAGLSHSCERPTSVSPAPSAQTISVPLASNEMTRITVPLEHTRCTAGPAAADTSETLDRSAIVRTDRRPIRAWTRRSARSGTGSRARRVSSPIPVPPRGEHTATRLLHVLLTVYDHIQGMCDALSDGIVKQFPDKFSAVGTSGVR